MQSQSGLPTLATCKHLHNFERDLHVFGICLISFNTSAFELILSLTCVLIPDHVSMLGLPIRFFDSATSLACSVFFLPFLCRQHTLTRIILFIDECICRVRCIEEEVNLAKSLSPSHSGTKYKISISIDAQRFEGKKNPKLK